LKIYINVNLY